MSIQKINSALIKSYVVDSIYKEAGHSASFCEKVGRKKYITWTNLNDIRPRYELEAVTTKAGDEFSKRTLNLYDGRKIEIFKNPHDKVVLLMDEQAKIQSVSSTNSSYEKIISDTLHELKKAFFG